MPRDALAQLQAAHMERLKNLMANQLAHERLIEAILVMLASALPPAERGAFLASLHEIAETWKTADSLFDRAAPALELAHAESLVRKIAAETKDIVDFVSARLAETAGSAAAPPAA